MQEELIRNKTASYQREPTRGELLMGITLNETATDHKDIVKQKFADLINTIDSARNSKRNASTIKKYSAIKTEMFDQQMQLLCRWAMEELG